MTELTEQEVKVLEDEVKLFREKQAVEAAEYTRVMKEKQKQLNIEARENDTLALMHNQVREFEGMVGDLKTNPDFLWFMICILLTANPESYQLRRAKNVGYASGSPSTSGFMKSILKAYKRSIK